MIFSTFGWCLRLLHSVNFVAKKLISWINTLERQCDTTKFTTISWLFLFLFTVLFFCLFVSFFFFSSILVPELELEAGIVWNSAKTRYESQSQSQSKNAMFVCFYDIECPMDERERWRERACQPTHIIKLNDLPQHRCIEEAPITVVKKNRSTHLFWGKNRIWTAWCFGCETLSNIFNVVIVVTMRFSSWPKIKWKPCEMQMLKKNGIAADKENGTKQQKKCMIKVKIKQNIAILDNIFSFIFRIYSYVLSFFLQRLQRPEIFPTPKKRSSNRSERKIERKKKLFRAAIL